MKSFWVALTACFFLLNHAAAFANEPPTTSPLSGEVVSLFQGGLELPVQLEISSASESGVDGAGSYEPSGTVLVEAVGLDRVSLSAFHFDPKYQRALSKLLSRQLSGSPIFLAGSLSSSVGDGSVVSLDIDEMMVVISVAPQDLNDAGDEPAYAKQASITNEASMLTNYNVNAYASGQAVGRLSDYNVSTSFNSVLSYEENHVEISNFSSFSSNSPVTHELDRLVFARDHKGLRAEAGLDTSAPQRIGTISNFSVNNLYYASITNSADSMLTRSAASSLIPMIVTMPAAGEVRVYKNERLIYQAALNIGRHTLDTTSFPAGVYEVKVDTVIAGRVRDTRTYRVNKPSNGRGGAQWVWQLWAGQAEYEHATALDDGEGDEVWGSTYTDPRKEHAPVGGVNLASSIGEVTWDSNLYRSPTSWVAELGSRWQPTDWLSLEGQWMKSSQGGRRAFYQASVSSSWGPSLLLTSERGQDDKDEYGAVSAYGTDQAQLQIPLPEALFGGSLGIGYSIDREYDERAWNIDYNQSLVDNDWLSLSLDTGVDRTLAEQATTNYYVSLNASFPIGGSVDMGVSEQNGVRTASLSAGMELDGFFNYVSIDAQGELAQQHIESPSTTLRTNYENDYSTGSVAMSLAQDSVNFSNSTSGLVAFNKDGIAPGKSGGQSGFMVIMPDYLEGGELELLVDNAATPLHAGNNFVSASPYEEHDVMVQVGGDARASYDIFTEDESYTLYPGNISTLKPTVKQMVTVFGRLVDESGTAIANASVKNHIGETITDEQGGFSIDVDASIPEVQVSSDRTGEFKVAMAIGNAAGGVVRLKDVVWSPHKSDVYIINPLF